MSKKINSGFNKRKAKRWVSYLLKVLLGLAIISPVLICLSFAFKPATELMGAGYAKLFPENPTFENFKWVINEVPVLTYLKNTLIQCAIVICAQLVLCSAAAYALTFFDFKGKDLLFTIILSSMMIPGDVVVITNYIQIQHWQLTDTHFGMAVPYLVGGMGIFLMRQFYLTVPKEMKEASEIDGCGDIRFLMRILMPISVPTYASLCIYDFIGVYNSWLWPLMVTNKDEMRTVQIGLARALNGDVYDEFALVLAASTVAIIPTIIVFVVAQEYLIRGMVSGSVKG